MIVPKCENVRMKHMFDFESGKVFFYAKMEVCIWFELKCIVGGFNC